MLRRSLPACLVALLVLAPAAVAFPSEAREVEIVYDAAAGPLALMSGSLAASGEIRDLFLLGSSVGSTFGPIPLLEVVARESGSQSPDGAALRGATLVLHDGALIARVNASGAALSLAAPYGIAIGVPDAPFGETSGPGLILAGENFTGALAFGAGEAMMMPLDAVVSIVDENGDPFAGWDHRAVNEDASPDAFEGAGEEGAGGAAVFRAHGPFDAALRAGVMGAAVGATGTLTLDASRADEPRFAETMRAIERLPGAGDRDADGGGESPAQGIEDLGPLAEVLNGGVLLMNVARDDAPAPTPLVATIGGEPADIDGFAMLRADEMRLAWGEGAMRVDGTAALAITGEGLSATAPTTLGPLPILSAILWLVAIGALVYFLVKRPEKVKEKFWPLRLGALAFHLIVLMLVFWWWDIQFAETFGTSFLTVALDAGAWENPMGVLIVLGFQLFPWGIAALLFALPVRIALGVALRYLGKGKALSGFAKAGGLVALAVFGPLYALWFMNTVIVRAIDAFPGF